MTGVFDLVVVGSGGGPDETNLSAYLLKAREAKWDDGIIALEAGCGQGALYRLMKQDPWLFNQLPVDKDQGKARPYSAGEIFSFVRSYLITHAHLDHISSLVISAGSLCGPRKCIYATKTILQDIETIFSGRIWPDLASWDDSSDKHKLLYKPLEADGLYHAVQAGISIRSFPLNHGADINGSYMSSAFSIRHDSSSTEFLFFGDVEPDSLVSTPRTIDIWRAVAPKIPNTLKAIFIECSWPSGRADDMLYGHLTPEHLVAELVALGRQVVKHRNSELAPRMDSARKRQKTRPVNNEELLDSLKGLHIYITHCKDNMTSAECEPMRRLITDQVRELVKAHQLGATIICTEPGMRISI